MRGGGATSNEAAPEYFGAKWHFAYCYKERSMDPKISSVIPCFVLLSVTLSNLTLLLGALLNVTLLSVSSLGFAEFHFYKCYSAVLAIVILTSIALSYVILPSVILMNFPLSVVTLQSIALQNYYAKCHSSDVVL
jgi:hypothetical protein